MRKITKENKGITIVALVLTIIIMLILVSVTTYTGLETYKKGKVTAFIAQMQLIQSKVDNLKETKEIDELLLLGSTVDSDKQNIINLAFSNNEISTNEASDYRYFSKEDLLSTLDIDDAYSDVMINFTTREVVSVQGIEYEDSTYYTQYNLPNGQKIFTSETIARDLSFTVDLSIDGINATANINDIQATNATLSYKESNDTYWQIITNYTEAGKSNQILISKSGTYTFKLQDNTSDTNNVVEQQIVVTNKPKTDLDLQSYNYGETSENWAYLEKDSTYYVWIPRFAYKTDTDTNSTNIKYIKGNSNIATDDTYVNSEWTINSKFTLENGTELTGLWVKVDSANQTGIDMIELLSSDVETLTSI